MRIPKRKTEEKPTVNPEIKVGDKIRITKMQGEPHYTGREGFVTSIKPDIIGEIQVRGTWGYLAVYPHKDKFILINDEKKDA